MPLWMSLIPPVLAIVLAVWKREVMLALVLALFSAELLMQALNPLAATTAVVERVVSVFADSGNTRILLFSLLIGALVAYMRDSGGVYAFVQKLEQRRLANSARKSSFLSIFTSMVLFIESNLSIFASALIATGLFDRYKMSRARLAYFVDSTCPTIKTLLPLNAWGAFLLSLLAPFFYADSTSVLLRSIPLNFYSWITLILVFYTAWTGKVYGPMREAESRVVYETPAPEVNAKSRFFWLPIVSLVVVMISVMAWTGNGDVLAGNSSKAVLLAVVGALVVSYGLLRYQSEFTHNELVKLGFKGMGELLPMVTLVLLAIALGASLKELGTAKAVTSMVGDFLPLWLVAPMVFLSGCFISFATGTSWGTFALLMPIAMPLAINLQIPPELVLAAVISGGVFGDHCSGISDTAIMSSLASGCDHYEHVQTQLPYAVVAAVLSMTAFIVVGLTWFGAM